MYELKAPSPFHLQMELFERLQNIPLPRQWSINHSSQIITGPGKDRLNHALTWRDLFDHIASKHWHTDGKATCPHAESLMDHLHATAALMHAQPGARLRGLMSWIKKRDVGGAQASYE